LAVIYQHCLVKYNTMIMIRSRIARLYAQLSLRVLVALGLFAVCMLAFVNIALEITEPHAPTLDQPVLLVIHAHASPMLDRLVPLLTDLGGVVVVALVAMGLIGWFVRRRQYRRALIMTLGVGGAAALNLLLKAFFSRPRPELWPRLVNETNFSFPSGHAMATMALAAALVAALWYTRWRIHAIIMGVVYVLIIGLTRLYLGVHYPTDVIGGWLIGAAWIAVVFAVLGRATQSSTVADAPSRSVPE